MTFFDGWSSLLYTAAAGLAAYSFVVLLLRTSGKRTLAKLNAFDLVVTVALGSTLASVMTSNTLPLANGLLALALLVVLQFAVAWLSLRSRWFERLVKSEPVLLFYDGRYLDGAIRSARLTPGEILAVARSSGQADMDEVKAVVLETDGSLSVVGKLDTLPGKPTLAGVKRPGESQAG